MEKAVSMRYKQVIFDMDGTLTESRGQASPALLDSFEKLCRAFTVAVISGADVGQMKNQLPFDDLWRRNAPLFLMAQNGNVCIHNGEEKWRTALLRRDKRAILDHIATLQNAFPRKVADEKDLVEDRGSQISFSFIGHNEQKQKKAEFDPKGAFRSEALAKIPFKHQNIAVKIGGTTCLDYIPKDGKKANNVMRLFGEKNLRDALFAGDSLAPGGNDAVMVGVADCVAVET